MPADNSLFYFSSPGAGDDQLSITRMAFDETMRAAVVDRHSTGDVFLLMVPAGCVLRDRFGIQELEKPGLIYWRERQPHYYGRSDQAWIHSWIHMHGSWMRRLSQVCPSNTCIQLDDVSMIEQCMRMIYDELQEPKSERQILYNSIETLLLHARRHLNNAEVAQGIPNQFIELKQYVDNHYQMPLSLQDLAKRVDLSSSHFSNRFREYFSCSPIEYLIRVRMEQSKHLLSNRSLRIQEVSELVGYEDVAYFSRLVKRYHGVNPRDLRKQILED